jgi:DNA-directed RNA polymerase subunit RPC12/RpoP
MDMVFSCPSCKQQLEADTSMAGNEIACPSCAATIVIPEANPMNIHVNPIASSAAAKQEYHFSVPVRDTPAEVLIKKPTPPLEAQARADGDKRLRVKCIRRTDCVEVGKDHFDDVVSDTLQKIGEANLISVTPLTYTHMDLGTRQMLTDFGVMIIFRA